MALGNALPEFSIGEVHRLGLVLNPEATFPKCGFQMFSSRSIRIGSLVAAFGRYKVFT